MVVVVAVVVVMVVIVTMIMADDDKVLAVPAEIVDARHSKRNFTGMREPRIRLEL
jgi:hypothetical protein